MRLKLVFWTLFFSMFMVASVAQEVIPKPTWSSNMTNFLLHYLQKNNESFITRKDPVTNQCYTFQITYEYLNPIVVYAVKAGKLNPSWGPPNLVALKLLTAMFGESSFDETCVRLNSNGSLDLGLLQINSCNWFLPSKHCAWTNFCKKEHLDPSNMKLFFDPEWNLKFAAYLNEYFVRVGQETYTYYDNPRRQRLYRTLIMYCGYRQLAQKYNDSQYPVQMAEK